jgi:hypothetical protein
MTDGHSLANRTRQWEVGGKAVSCIGQKDWNHVNSNDL